MNRKRVFFILICVALCLGLITFTGCGKEAGPEDQNGNDAPAEQTYRVTLFFANDEYIATGNESLEKFMVFENEMTAIPGEAYVKSLELLKSPPEEGYSTLITDQIKFNEVYIDGETIFVDLNSSGLNGGSLQEAFLISQIVNTLLNTFDEAAQVQFLVDGETAETLMGHVDATAPFTKDVFSE